MFSCRRNVLFLRVRGARLSASDRKWIGFAMALPNAAKINTHSRARATRVIVTVLASFSAAPSTASAVACSTSARTAGTTSRFCKDLSGECEHQEVGGDGPYSRGGGERAT